MKTAQSLSILQRIAYLVVALSLIGAIAVACYPVWAQYITGTRLGAFLERRWEELLVGLIVTVLGGAVLGLFAVAPAWLGKRKNSLSVRLCKRPSHDQVASIVELYASKFGDDENYDANELKEILETGPDFADHCPLPTENLLVVAEREEELRGFLLTHFYPTEHKAIISYLAVSKSRRERSRPEEVDITTRLIQVLAESLREDDRCGYVFYEVADTASSTDPILRNRQKARVVRFKSLAAEAGVKAYHLDFPYRCPRVSVQATARESDAMLLCIPLGAPLTGALSREQVRSFLKFLYVDCYGDFYPMESAEFRDHRGYLEKFLAERSMSLPDVIPVRS